MQNKRNNFNYVTEGVLACKTGIEDLDSQLQAFKPGEITTICSSNARIRTMVAKSMYEHIIENENVGALYIEGPRPIYDLGSKEMREKIVSNNVGILILNFGELFHLNIPIEEYDRPNSSYYGGPEVFHDQDFAIKELMRVLRCLAYDYGISVLLCFNLIRRTMEEKVPSIIDVNQVIAKNSHNIILMSGDVNSNGNCNLSNIIDDIEFIVARDSDNISDRAKVEGRVDSCIKDFVEETMKMPIYISSFTPAGKYDDAIISIKTNEFEIQFFDNAESFKIAELKESIGDKSIFENKDYSLLCTLKLKIYGRIWIVRIGGVGSSYGDGRIVDCTAFSGKMLKEYFATFKACYS